MGANPFIEYLCIFRLKSIFFYKNYEKQDINHYLLLICHDMRV